MVKALDVAATLLKEHESGGYDTQEILWHRKSWLEGGGDTQPSRKFLKV